jgi:hypothetical protein
LSFVQCTILRKAQVNLMKIVPDGEEVTDEKILAGIDRCSGGD